MILKAIGTAALLALSAASLAQTSSPSVSSSSAEMGRGRCEALADAEKEKCLVDERAASVAVPAPQRSDERK